MNLNICFIGLIIDSAAQNGHLEIVKWLHNNRKEGYTVNAIDLVAQHDHSEVVKWLRKS